MMASALTQDEAILSTENQLAQANANPLQLPKYQVPHEVVSNIIFHIVAEGFQISLNPSYESNKNDIRSLLRTSLQVKHETLRQIYRQPFIINLANPPDCGCKEQAPMVLPSILKKVLPFPIAKWPRVLVRFLPIMEQDYCESEDRNWGYRDRGATHQKFSTALKCLRRQSQELSQFLKRQDHPSYGPRGHQDDDLTRQDQNVDVPAFTHLPNQHQFEPDKPGRTGCATKVAFAFDDCKDFRRANAAQNIPLWDLDTVDTLLHDWDWIEKSPMDGQVQLPST